MKIFRRIYRWYWRVSDQSWNLRLTPFGTGKATVWTNGTWHTWDNQGIGGYNGIYEYKEFSKYKEWHYAAKREAFKACIEQGFI